MSPVSSPTSWTEGTVTKPFFPSLDGSDNNFLMVLKITIHEGKNNNPRPLLVNPDKRTELILGLGAILIGRTLFVGLTGGRISCRSDHRRFGLVVGLIYILVGVGFLSGWSIMWYLGIILGALAIILNVLSLFVGTLRVIPILISLIIILYLLKPNVKRFFLE